MFKRLAHVCIGAADLALTEDFYVNKLGMEKAFDFIRAGQRIGFYIKVGEDTFLEVFAQNAQPNTDATLLKHVCLQVEDIDASIERLNAKGVEVSAKKWGTDNAWQAWITDPSGVRIELMQYTEGSTQLTGEAVLLD